MPTCQQNKVRFVLGSRWKLQSIEIGIGDAQVLCLT